MADIWAKIVVLGLAVCAVFAFSQLAASTLRYSKDKAALRVHSSRPSPRTVNPLAYFVPQQAPEMKAHCSFAWVPRRRLWDSAGSTSYLDLADAALKNGKLTQKSSKL
jgi:hypothetical protein